MKSVTRYKDVKDHDRICPEFFDILSHGSLLLSLILLLLGLCNKTLTYHDLVFSFFVIIHVMCLPSRYG